MIFGKPYDGSICKFGEQVHYKLSGRPSSRAELQRELGATIGKHKLTHEHLLGTLAGIRGSRTIYRLPKIQCCSKDALDRIVRTQTNPKPHGAARDPVVRRQYITQRWVEEHGVAPGCLRCQGRGTMSDAIEKKQLDRQLEEARKESGRDGGGAGSGTSDDRRSLKLLWTRDMWSGGGDSGKSKFTRGANGNR